MLAARGYSPLLIERHNALPSLGQNLPEGVEFSPGTVLTGLKGQVGSFTASIRNGSGVREVECGAVILASGFSREKDALERVRARFSSPLLVPLYELEEAAAGFGIPQFDRGIIHGIVDMFE